MKNVICYFLFVLFFTNCKKEPKASIIFLDDFVLNDSLLFQNTYIGGLSGVDYTNGFYYFVVDDAKNPRFLKAKITIQKDKIVAVNFKKTIFLKDATTNFYHDNILDLESIFVDEKTQDVYFVSEGSINKNKKPTIFKTDSLGFFKQSFKIPNNLLALKNIKHNGVFEASSKSVDKKGFWVAMEAPLKIDGEEPTFYKTNSPIRITYFNNTSQKATKQFAYPLEPISKPKKGNINLNGVTAILEYKKNQFLVVERAYQNGYESYGNTVRIFEATIDKTSTNTINIKSLKNTNFIPLKKRLLVDFDSLKSKLTLGIIDNIEGITFGPKSSNGNQTILLVSDDNFQLYGKQLNQFILLEIAHQ